MNQYETDRVYMELGTASEIIKVTNPCYHELHIDIKHGEGEFVPVGKLLRGDTKIFYHVKELSLKIIY